MGAQLKKIQQKLKSNNFQPDAMNTSPIIFQFELEAREHTGFWLC